MHLDCYRIPDCRSGLLLIQSEISGVRFSCLLITIRLGSTYHGANVARIVYYISRSLLINLICIYVCMYARSVHVCVHTPPSPRITRGRVTRQFRKRRVLFYVSATRFAIETDRSSRRLRGVQTNAYILHRAAFVKRRKRAHTFVITDGLSRLIRRRKRRR